MAQNYLKKQSFTLDGELVKQQIIQIYNPFKEGVGYNFKYKSAFIKNYLSISLPEEFSDLELGRLYRVSKMLYSDSNLLAKRIKSGIIPFDRGEIQEMLMMHRTKFVPFWKKLFEFGIVKLIEIGGVAFFCMSPLYFNTTTYMPLYLFIAFKDELHDHVPEWVIEKYLELSPSKMGVCGEAVISAREDFKEANDETEEWD